MVEKYPGEADLKNVRSHLHKFLYTGLQAHTDLRDRISDAKSLEVLKEVVKEMIERRKEIYPPSKIAWYYRYWASMSAVRGQDKTFRTLEWDSQISQDPLFNKALKDKQDLTRDKPKGESVVNDSIIDSGALDMDLGGFLDGTMGEDGC